ncbi:virginiamycin B lyase family protein [Pseudoteredinibacter isoporae]|uniref:Streptogramin lyase n=1 Tax=Pseudoteredinibacter isoporae TaxID=570281 RepID=A0A7X0MUP3_9GAMM|nr:lyase [Pseudoteredinibacter isoporae]MBB6520245.1 streptogramin lyase [Pseudoteredinibacter isoporae]NHO85817.1 lyase [Pseudoteredinibacter isoporae]NIB25731.1 lyase [Pseudoteredinibacter isoporae]
MRLQPQALIALALSSAVSFSGIALAKPEITVTDKDGTPLPTAMVSRILDNKPTQDLSDNGYSPHGVANKMALEHNRFSNKDGKVLFDGLGDSTGTVTYRVRKPGYQDRLLRQQDADSEITISLEAISDPKALADAKPSNVWINSMDFEGDKELKKHFQLNCAFCHQQGSAFMRAERSPEQWLDIINRMGKYGARVADEDKERLAAVLSRQYKKLNANTDKLVEPRPWSEKLSDVEIIEYPIGDAFSQMHDFLVHPNGFVYVGDNLQDRIYEVNPETGDYKVYVVPHEKDAKLGGILGNRFGEMIPKLYNYMGVHSFAVSPKDGHIFITPSMQQALIEFNPHTKEFTTHKMDDGYYPHTIRADGKGRIWFTLAVSSQVASWDRNKKEFKIYNLPARSFKEWMIIKSIPFILSLDVEDRPLPKVDRKSTGVPMPYGIDVAPDGKIWFARLYGDDIGFIDPETDEVSMIQTPFKGPRRLRVDADNNLWIVAFQDSQLAKYDPRTKKFTMYDLPVVNELPYSLNIDRPRRMVWVNGNQSDTIFSFDIDKEEWLVYPMPRKRTFTRDIEVGEDGSIYTSNSHFPSWQIEDGQPTLIRVKPTDGERVKATKTEVSVR